MSPISLSVYHKIFYNEWQLAPLSSKYNIVFDQTIANSLDIHKLKYALERLIADYLILNCHISNINGEPYWVENSYIRSLEVFEGITSYGQLYNYVAQPFNVEKEPLYRFAIFNQADGNYRFIIVWHHLIIDGNSFSDIIDKISYYYNDNSYKMQASLSMQHNIITNSMSILNNKLNKHTNTNKQFWDKIVKDLEAIDLTFLRPSTSQKPLEPKPGINPIKELRFEFDDTIGLSYLIKKYNITFYSYSQSVFAILIYLYTGQKKFGLAYTFAIKEQSNLIHGTGVNTNIYKYNFINAGSIAGFFKKNENIINLLKSKKYNYGYYPINYIVNNVCKSLLDVFFIKTNLKENGLALDGAPTLSINNEFNIDLSTKLIFEQEFLNGKLKFRVRYDYNKIDEVILKQFIAHYQKLFKDILSDLHEGNTDKKISDYSVLSLEEYNKIVYQFNNNTMTYPDNKTIHQLFEEQVLKTPDNVALVYQDISLTYAELNKKANQLAHYILSTHYIKPDDLVALYLERNEYMLIAILAVLKAGGAYVPLDPSYPLERIELILNNSQASLLIINNKYMDKLSKSINYTNTEPALIALDSNNLQLKIETQPLTDPTTKLFSNHLAYVIYTSGTTGKPKGVMVEHKSVINLVAFQSNLLFNIPNHIYKCLWYSSYIFDAHVWDIYAAISKGNTIYIISNQVRYNINLLVKYISKNNIEIATIPPALIANNKLDLATLIVAGEKTDSYTLDNILSENVEVINAYGLTETTVCTNMNYYSSIRGASVIGKPLSNIKCYILDYNLLPLPIGSVGELYIGGAGLARGYLNNPELTAQRFLANPFQTETEKAANINSRLYKTGDLVRWLSDGNIEYIGRNDSQVKIRGYRIELGEIEYTLSSCIGIKQAIVTVNNIPLNSDNKYLVVYYVADEQLNEDEITQQLSRLLPQYMLPNIYIRVQQLPITINGKIDKAKLPAPSFKTDNYIAPHTQTERIICEQFAKVLSIPINKIGSNSDFFKLGGNSILVISLVAALKQHGLSIAVDDVFTLRNVAQIAAQITHTKMDIAQHLQKVKLLYQKLSISNLDPEILRRDRQRQQDYLKHAQEFTFIPQLKPINNVLLTGATGYLGANLLYQLLTKTNYAIYMLVRANSNQEAYARVAAKFNFYFDEDLAKYNHRIKVLASDIEQTNLNLDNNSYSNLVEVIDSIIHAAALVRHYGEYESFYKANVQATINLLELSKLTKLKDFHYVSTISVFMDGYIPKHSYYSFNEYDNDNALIRGTNLYSKTKYEGEQATISYRRYGVQSNIYRVGNLLLNSQNYKCQENIKDNASFTRLKTILHLGIIPEELYFEEISPVDFTALAIIKIFNQQDLSSSTYHLFNPNIANLHKLFSKYEHINVIIKSFDKFLATILAHLKSSQNNKLIDLFMLHQGWLHNFNQDAVTKINILQKKTQIILAQLGFQWIPITSNMLSDIIVRSFHGEVNGTI